MIVRDIDELMVLNDDAHHIHDPRMAWFKSIEDIHNRLKQKGAALSMQVDTTATPKHNNGAIFVQTVTDYSLVEAISQNIVKHPVLGILHFLVKKDTRISLFDILCFLSYNFRHVNNDIYHAVIFAIACNCFDI